MSLRIRARTFPVSRGGGLLYFSCLLFLQRSKSRRGVGTWSGATSFFISMVSGDMAGLFPLLRCQFACIGQADCEYIPISVWPCHRWGQGQRMECFGSSFAVDSSVFACRSSRPPVSTYRSQRRLIFSRFGGQGSDTVDLFLYWYIRMYPQVKQVVNKHIPVSAHSHRREGWGWGI